MALDGAFFWRTCLFFGVLPHDPWGRGWNRWTSWQAHFLDGPVRFVYWFWFWLLLNSNWRRDKFITLYAVLFGAESRSGPDIENQGLEQILLFKHGKLTYPCKLHECICGRWCWSIATCLVCTVPICPIYSGWCWSFSSIHPQFILSPEPPKEIMNTMSFGMNLSFICLWIVDQHIMRYFLTLNIDKLYATYRIYA